MQRSGSCAGRRDGVTFSSSPSRSIAIFADDVELELTLRALHRDVLAVDRDIDAARHRDGFFPIRDMTRSLPDLTENLAAHAAPPRLTVGHEALVGRHDRDAHSAEHARHAVGRE